MLDLANIPGLFQSRKSPLILLIDDENMTRIQVRRFLEHENYQVIEAANGQEGLDAYKRLHPDMVLVDGMMPVMDGFECCAQMQALAGAAHTPVLMITGLEDEKSVDRAFTAGATDYITKPIHWAVLRQRVKRLIQQSQLVKQLEATNQMFQQMASVDILTQLANRRLFDVQLEQEWRRMAREKAPLSLILCDVDYFKQYNDTTGYGHQRGDECLKHVAVAIGTAVKRAGDLAARYGGEEFAVILPNTPLEGAVKIAERIRSNLQRMELVHPNSAVSNWVTLSLGIATVLPHEMTQILPNRLVITADKALYQAKATGRDRYCTRLVA